MLLIYDATVVGRQAEVKLGLTDCAVPRSPRRKRGRRDSIAVKDIRASFGLVN